MEGIKKKLDEWGSGWRLMLSVITPILGFTVWLFAQLNSIEDKMHQLEINILFRMNEYQRTIIDVRNEMNQTNLVYHERVKAIDDNLKEHKVLDEKKHSVMWKEINSLRAEKYN